MIASGDAAISASTRSVASCERLLDSFLVFELTVQLAYRVVGRLIGGGEALNEIGIFEARSQ